MTKEHKGNDTLDGGDGDDLASYRFDDIGLTTGVIFSAEMVGLSATVSMDDGRGGFDTLTSIERVQLTGSAFDDTLTAGLGDDFVSGNGGGDELIGLSGNDVLNGGIGDDVLEGGAGDDELLGGDGMDIVAYRFDRMDVTSGVIFDGNAFGGPARTRLRGAVIGTDWLEGIERLEITGSTFGDTIAATKLDDFVDGGDGDDSLDGFRGADVLTGGAGADTIRGGDDADELTGGDDADALFGDAGDDTLYGGSGTDTLSGGGGDDTYHLGDDDDPDVIVEAAKQGYDTIVSRVSYDLTANVEKLIFEDTILARDCVGNVLANEIVGNSFANALDGGAGNDVLRGDAGDDVLTAGAGVDTLYGGTDDDTYVVQDTRATIVELADEGIDTVIASVTWVLEDNIENLTLKGAKARNALGNDLDNIIKGTDFVNELVGGDGDDTLIGGGGGDLLQPGAGEDLIRILSVADSTGPAFDTIFGGAFDGEDRIDLAVRPAAIATYDLGVLTEANFDRDLKRAIDGSLLAPGGAVLFDPARGDFEATNIVFLVVDANGVAGYQAGQDYVIGLQNFTGTIDIGDFI